MTKKAKIAISVSLSAVLLCGIIVGIVLLATRCGKDGGGSVYTPPADTETPDGGVHESEITETGDYILRNGQTGYAIVVPAAADANVMQAASDIMNYFAEATGVTLSVVPDTQAAYSADARYISLGHTKLLTDAGVQLNASLGRDGFQIVTEGKTVFISGSATGYGTMYGAIEFLSLLLGFEYYYLDYYVIDENVSTVPLMDYNVLEIPTFDRRLGTQSSEVNRFFRIRSLADDFLLVNGANFHNEFYWFDADQRAAHPEWVASNGMQICYNANGDAESRAEMIDAAFERLKATLKQNPDPNVDYVNISAPDNVSFCSCSACAAVNEQYGANSASVILFLNELNKKIRPWFETEEGAPYKRDLTLTFLAYHSMVAPPDPDTGIRCDDGVAVVWAPIHADFTQPFETTGVNEAYRQYMDDWAAVSPEKLDVWFYSTNFMMFMAPYDMFNSQQSLYKQLAERGTVLMYEEGGDYQYAMTGWTMLKSWLGSKIKWNVNVNVGELTDRFFADVFGPAAEPMRTFFDEERLWIERLRENGNPKYGGLDSNYQYQHVTRENWTKPVLTRWMDLMDEAIAAIEPVRVSDPERWQFLYDHITLERVSILYMLIDLHQDTYSDAEYLELQAMFKEDTSRLGVTKISGNTTVASYTASWTV